MRAWWADTKLDNPHTTVPKLSQLAFIAFAAATSLASANEPVFREPHTFRLHLDKERYMEQKVGKVPYVHNGAVYLFKNDNFGINLNVENGALGEISYLPAADKADVSLNFSQRINADGSSMMMLEIVNRTRYTLNLNALMVVPNSKGPASTSILPVRPGLTNFETWPHPIAQLVLHKLTIQP